MKTVCDGLFEIDHTMTAMPRSAASSEPDADGTRWRITLRDTQWHDGKKLTTIARFLAGLLNHAHRLAVIDDGRIVRSDDSSRWARMTQVRVRGQRYCDDNRYLRVCLVSQRL